MTSRAIEIAEERREMLALLSPRQARFVQNYLVSLDAKQAAIEAGYKESSAASTGSSMLRQEKIRNAIQEQMDNRSRRTMIDQDFVLEELYKILQRCMQEVKPQLNAKTGKPITDENGQPIYTFNANGALKALDQIAKHVKVDAYGASKMKIEGDVNLVERLQKARSRVSEVDGEGEGNEEELDE